MKIRERGRFWRDDIDPCLAQGFPLALTSAGLNMPAKAMWLCQGLGGDFEPLLSWLFLYECERASWCRAQRTWHFDDSGHFGCSNENTSCQSC